MTTPQNSPTTTVTVTRTIPAALGDELGIAAADRDPGDVLLVEHDIAVRLVTNNYARFGSAAQEAASGSMGQRHVFRASATLDFPSIPAGGNASLTVAVPGAEVGEPVALSRPAVPADVFTAASVTAPGVVTVTVYNTNATTAADLAAGTFSVAVVNDDRK